jgi:pimeloyl-ACP methyl ester carboxylesterase
LEKAVENIGEPVDPSTKIEVPTLFVKGETSRYISEKDEEEIKTIFPDSKLVSISGAGHWVQAEKPDEFAGVVNGFLRS